MSKPKILEAGIIQKVQYESPAEMYRINAQKANNGQLIEYLKIHKKRDGTVTALIMFPYNNKPILSDLEV